MGKLILWDKWMRILLTSLLFIVVLFCSSLLLYLSPSRLWSKPNTAQVTWECGRDRPQKAHSRHPWRIAGRTLGSLCQGPRPFRQMTEALSRRPILQTWRWCLTQERVRSQWQSWHGIHVSYHSVQSLCENPSGSITLLFVSDLLLNQQFQWVHALGQGTPCFLLLFLCNELSEWLLSESACCSVLVLSLPPRNVWLS